MDKIIHSGALSGYVFAEKVVRVCCLFVYHGKGEMNLPKNAYARRNRSAHRSILGVSVLRVVKVLALEVGFPSIYAVDVLTGYSFLYGTLQVLAIALRLTTGLNYAYTETGFIPSPSAIKRYGGRVGRGSFALLIPSKRFLLNRFGKDETFYTKINKEPAARWVLYIEHDTGETTEPEWSSPEAWYPA